MATASGGAPMDRLGFLLAVRGAITDAQVRSALGVTGLSPRHAMTLMYLDDAGPVSQQKLAELLAVDPSQLVAILNDLERDEFARRRRDPADRRRHIVEITPQGAATLETTSAALTRCEDELFADLTQHEREQLSELLNRIRTAGGHYNC
ncbi:MarR family winged helix-turn-helix transcriptional regulator [Streptomyces sp. NPDC002643]